PAAVVPGLVIAASVWGFAGFESFVPLYARDLRLDGVRYVFLTYAVTVMFVRLFGARIPDRFGPRRTASVSLVTSAVGLLGMTVVASKLGLYGGVVVFALGQALAFPALMTMAVATSPESERSSTIATFTAFVDLGFGLGPAAAGGVVALFGNRAAFVAGAVSAVIGFAILRTRPEVRSPGDPGAAVPEVNG
ncbi:MAG: MFS transporter, partial [Actinobacteria bacterium]|nr:MFS transporter [Actinomycetota bacterium]